MAVMRLSPAEKLARDLDWNLLRVFLALAEAGSVTGAGERLGLKQPSVSQALRRLEDRVGARLIDRGPGRFSLTPEGDRVLREAREVREAVLRLSESIAEAQAEVSGPVTLAMASHVVCPLLDQTLSAFHRAHPAATLSIEVMASREALARTMTRQVSFAICLLTDTPQPLETTPLYREFFGLFCGPGHPLFGRDGLQLADLQGQDSVSFQTDRMGDALQAVTNLRRAAGLEERTVGQSTHLEEVRRMIVAGLGIGPLPLHVVAEDVATRRLWRLPPLDAPPAIDVHLVWHAKPRHNRAEATLLSQLRKAIAATPMEARIYRG